MFQISLFVACCLFGESGPDKENPLFLSVIEEYHIVTHLEINWMDGVTFFSIFHIAGQDCAVRVGVAEKGNLFSRLQQPCFAFLAALLRRNIVTEACV